MNELMGLLIVGLPLLVCGLGISIMLSLPMIWFHCGHISRKQDEIIKLLKEGK